MTMRNDRASKMHDKLPLDLNDRVLLFHISRIIFHYTYKSNKKNLFKGQIKYKDQLINDTLSTLISICDIFNKISNGQIHINRFGTNPINHNFGIIRMAPKDHYKVQRSIKETSKNNMIRRLREDMIMESIKHRGLQFGRIVNKSYA